MINDTNSNKEIERRLRLQEWFKSDPEIWQDILDEGQQALHNEYQKLEARECTNREWSSGFVAGQKFLMSMEEYLRKKWTVPKVDKNSQKQM
jgi:hypothetical protein